MGKTQATKKKKPNLLDTGKRSEQQRTIYACSKCGKELYKFKYEEHRKHCKKDNAYKASLRKLDITESGGIFSCNKCKTSFSNKGNCVAHVKKQKCLPKHDLDDDDANSAGDEAQVAIESPIVEEDVSPVSKPDTNSVKKMRAQHEEEENIARIHEMQAKIDELCLAKQKQKSIPMKLID